MRRRSFVRLLACVFMLAVAWVVDTPSGGTAFAADPQTKPPFAITSIQPNRGPSSGYSSLWLTGGGFTDDTQVFFGTPPIAARFLRADASHAVVWLPPAKAGTVDVTLVSPGGERVTLTRGFMYVNDLSYTTPPPAIVSMTPQSGPESIDTGVFITGASFQPGMLVFVGAQRVVVKLQANNGIACTFPHQSARQARVVVTSPDGRSASFSLPFVFVARPTIASVAAGITVATRVFTSGGAAITISGTGFQSGAVVLVGTANATSVVVKDAQTITAVTPPAPAGAADVTIQNPDGQSAVLKGAINVLALPPPPPHLHLP